MFLITGAPPAFAWYLSQGQGGGGSTVQFWWLLQWLPGSHLSEHLLVMGFLQLAYVGAESVQGSPYVVEGI